MPTYEYRCREGHRFEVFQRISDQPVSECPECRGDAERIVSGGAGFLFKGEGFYITDHRSEEYRRKASAEGGGASSTREGSSSSGDSPRGDAPAKEGAREPRSPSRPGGAPSPPED